MLPRLRESLKRMWQTVSMTPRSSRLQSLLVFVIAALGAAFVSAAPAECASREGPAGSAALAPATPNTVAETPSTTAGALDPALTQTEEADESADPDGGDGWMSKVDATMKNVNEQVGSVIFYPIPIPFTKADAPTELPFTGGKTTDKKTIKFAVMWLVLGALFFTTPSSTIEPAIEPNFGERNTSCMMARPMMRS